MNDQNNSIDRPVRDSKPFLSIIMPVYNAAPYLQECLESIIAQDFQDWEAVLVDDCSSDSSVAIAESYGASDPRIRLFSSQRNSGSAYSPRLLAAKLARANYVVTVDADDKVSPDLLSKLHKKIVTLSADLVIPELWRMENGSSRRILPSEKIITDEVWDGRVLIGHTLIDWEIPMCGFAARRNLYLEAAKHVTDNDRKSIFSDELHSRWLLSLCGNVVMCDARYFYRNNDASVTNINLNRVVASRMHTCDGLIAMTSTVFGKESPIYLRALEDKLYSAAGLLRLINRSSLDRQLKREGQKIISTYMKKFDFSKLRGKTSPRYLALMSLPTPLAALALHILDPILRK